MRLLSATASVSPTGRRLNLGGASPSMAAYLADSPDDSAAVAALLSELALGRREERWLQAPISDGEAHIRTTCGEIALKRSGGASGRLTLAPIGTRAAGAPAPSPAEWQGEVPPAVLGAVFFGAPTEVHPLRPLLSVRVAETFTQLSRRRRVGDSPAGYDRRPADELLRRRDDLAGRIEALLSSRRSESGELDAAIGVIDQRRDDLAARVEELRRRVRALGEQLDAQGARVRYEELTRVAAEAEDRQAADQWVPRVEELDEEVARWRATLAELESREAVIRSELARVRPDDAAPQLLLADQRASVAVAQRLVADLESEVARFATSGESPLCVCPDAHPRMNPLVETLGRHLDRLATLISQQDDALRTQDLMAEAAQLERSQDELRRQLEQLLERRQTLHRSSRARSTREDRFAGVYAEPIDALSLEREHAALSEQLRRLEAELEAVDRERTDTVERRRRLLDEAQLADWQRELDAVQTELARVGERPVERAAGSLRASDVLARLTDGELTELRLAGGGRSVEARDRTGRIVREAGLSTLETRLVAWALRLALADAAHEAGQAFPLVLDQPFADLDDRHAANLATALDDYARRGRQVVLFTRDGAGLARLRSLGVEVRSFTSERVEVSPTPPASRTRTVVREEATTRAWVLDVEDPIDRFPIPLPDREAAFARSRVRTVGELIDGDPSAIAEEIGVEGVTAELVALWQAHLALVCFTPGLDLAAAKLLVECDLLTVEQLAEADGDHLVRALRKRGATEAQLRRVEEWIEGAADGVERWKSSGYAERWRRNRRERRERIRKNSSRRAAGGRSLRIRDERDDERDDDREPRRRRRRRREATSTSERTESRSEKKTLRFYLEVTSDVEAAPSIGPKRAGQLTALGVATVQQLLDCDPEDIAARLDDSRVDAATIVAWQHQAGLMCRVPGLRGHDAQVLVGSGFASAEEIAGMKPAELLEFVDPFCDTPEGQRALRGSARPDLAEVTQWIAGARQRRAVGAA